MQSPTRFFDEMPPGYFPLRKMDDADPSGPQTPRKQPANGNPVSSLLYLI